MKRIQDMTSGNPAKLIFFFALPLMLGNVFQQMYTMVDTIIVGQVVGVQALAALGVCEWIIWLIQGVASGFSQGFSILISQRFGAEDGNGLRKSVTMSAVLAGIIGISMTILSFLTIRPILKILNTPDNILSQASSYLHILLGGLLVYTAYNTMAAVLRAMGDGRTPLYAMVIASVVNISLDLLFVVTFRWGVEGAAAATVIAQFSSCLCCMAALRRIPQLQMDASDWKLEPETMGRLLSLGFPICFQNIIISVGGLVVQTVVNGFGMIFVAGFTATNKLYGILEVAATSFGFSMATYTGQNLGAGKYQRIKQGGKSAVIMAIGTALVISASMVLFGRKILMLFISAEPDVAAQVLDVAYTYLLFMCSMLFVLYLLYVYRSGLQGMGDTIIPLVSGIAELVMRISAAVLLPLWIGQGGIYFAEILAWLAAELLLMAFFYYRLYKLLKQGDKISHAES